MTRELTRISTQPPIIKAINRAHLMLFSIRLILSKIGIHVSLLLVLLLFVVMLLKLVIVVDVLLLLLIVSIRVLRLINSLPKITFNNLKHENK